MHNNSNGAKFDYANNPTWRIFRIMAEFVDGFDFIANYEPVVTIFGSARLPQDHPSSIQAHELASRLGKAGFKIMTGGGPGIMEAANRGAREADADSLGLNIELPLEQRINKYITKGIGFHYFFTRKVMMVFSSEAYVFFPGGFGTLDEFFELITLIQTEKIEDHIPIICIGSDFWLPLMDFIREKVYGDYHAIDARDQQIWRLTDSIDEAFSIIKNCQPRRRALKEHRDLKIVR